jgi:hypothetical protein
MTCGDFVIARHTVTWQSRAHGELLYLDVGHGLLRCARNDRFVMQGGSRHPPARPGDLHVSIQIIGATPDNDGGGVVLSLRVCSSVIARHVVTWQSLARGEFL